MSSPDALPSRLKQPLRERVLDAAERIVAREGAAHLTLDAVAAEAGVSKGGMLYHFRSKDALLQGLVHRTLDRFGSRVEDLQKDIPQEDPHRRGRARLSAAIEWEPAGPDLGITVIAAAAHNPDLLAPGKALLADTAKAMQDLEEDVPTARLVWLAMHGLQFLDILGISPFSPDDKTTLRDQARRILNSAGDSR